MSGQRQSSCNRTGSKPTAPLHSSFSAFTVHLIPQSAPLSTHPVQFHRGIIIQRVVVHHVLPVQPREKRQFLAVWLLSV
jgi:hypothetical protein